MSHHAGALKEVEALHAGHAGAAQRAEESLAELALVRETQAALTAQVLPSLQHLWALEYVAEACNTCWHLLNASIRYQPLHEGCPQQGTNAFLAERLQRLAI